MFSICVCVCVFPILIMTKGSTRIKNKKETEEISIIFHTPQHSIHIKNCT